MEVFTTLCTISKPIYYLNWHMQNTLALFYSSQLLYRLRIWRSFLEICGFKSFLFPFFYCYVLGHLI